MPDLSHYFRFKHTVLCPASESDVEPIVAMINDAYSYQDSAKGGPRINAPKLRERMRTGEFYVVKRNDHVVGCVHIEKRAGHVLHFGLLTVADELRGKGLGGSIIGAVESYARNLPMAAIELDYMSLAPWLKTYYEGYGFAGTGEIIPWGSINLIRMAKRL